MLFHIVAVAFSLLVAIIISLRVAKHGIYTDSKSPFVVSGIIVFLIMLGLFYFLYISLL